jgi:hypothetical protein
MKNVPVKLSTLALLMSAIFAYPALAQAAEDTKPLRSAGAAPTGGQKDKDMSQFSQAGHSAMMNIGDARLAIFNGEPKTAMKLMESAKTFLAQADKDAPSTGGVTPADKANPGAMNTMGPKIRSVPVDGQLSLADDFVMTPEKKVHVDKANESFKTGDHATGLEELRLGAIDVNYTRWWLPIAPTESHLDQAIKLANESKYYEANLALKSIEDSVTMDSISFSDLPTPTKSAKTKS